MPFYNSLGHSSIPVQYSSPVVQSINSRQPSGAQWVLLARHPQLQLVCTGLMAMMKALDSTAPMLTVWFIKKDECVAKLLCFLIFQPAPNNKYTQVPYTISPETCGHPFK